VRFKFRCNILISGKIIKEMPGSVASGTPYISITNKMQRYKIFFITVNTVHVSGVFSANHQELKTVRTALGICQACLLLLLAIANTFLYYCKCSTCFRRFLGPSSGAENCTHNTGYMSSLLAAIASDSIKFSLLL